MSKFEGWIDELLEKVIEDEYGYERGEFDVFPELWRPYFHQKLTPQQAFRRALDAAAEGRNERDRAREEGGRSRRIRPTATRRKVCPAHAQMTAQQKRSSKWNGY